jgi:hypothetical protein
MKSYKNCDVLKKYIFLVTYCKRFHPKSPFNDTMKMTIERIAILESFTIIGSFDCDCTLQPYLCVTIVGMKRKTLQ